MAEEQPATPEHAKEDLPPLANVAPPPPFAQAFPALYPPAGSAAQPQVPPTAQMAPAQGPGGFPVFAPPVSNPYNMPYGPAPGYLDAPVRLRRPKVLTATGIASIVVAIVGILGAVVTAIGATGFLITGDAAAAVQVRMATELSTAPPDAPSATVKASPGPKGMDEQDRNTVILALSAMEPIPDNRREQLDLVLTFAGKAMFPKAGGLLNAEAVEGMVKNHGEMFSAKQDALGTSYFVTEGGRLDLYDERAVFRPADGSPTVRVAANPPPPIGLTAEEVESVLSQVQVTTKNALNVQQQATLRVMLADPNQDLIPPNRLTAAVASSSSEGGAITIKFTGGRAISLGPQGQSLAPGAVPPPKVNRILFGCLIALAGLSLAVAIYLFIAGVQMLRGRFISAGRMHGRYAWIKIATTIAVIVLSVWLRSDFITRLTDALETSSATSVPPTLPLWGPRLIALATLGLVYPIILLIVMRLGGVRTHLESKPNHGRF